MICTDWFVDTCTCLCIWMGWPNSKIAASRHWPTWSRRGGRYEHPDRNTVQCVLLFLDDCQPAWSNSKTKFETSHLSEMRQVVYFVHFYTVPMVYRVCVIYERHLESWVVCTSCTYGKQQAPQRCHNVKVFILKIQHCKLYISSDSYRGWHDHQNRQLLISFK